MKAKQVHAQRKYAQGAHISISNPSTPAERRVVEAGVQNTSKVFYNNNDAKNLLDIVSFSNIHKHTQPIVLVKRLENTLDAFKNAATEERSIPNHRTNYHLLEDHNAAKPERHESDKEIILTSPSLPSKKKAGRPFKLVTKRLLRKKVRRSNRLLGKPSPKLKKTILFKKTIKPKAKIIKTRKVIKFSKPPVTEANDLEAICPLADDNLEPLTYLKLIRNKPQQATIKGKAGTEESTTTNVKNKNLKTKKKFDEPAIEPVPETEQSSQSVKDSKNGGSSYCETSNGIERWMSESTKNINKSKDFKVPELPQKKKKIDKSPTKIRKVTKNVSPPKNTCPSIKFVYLKDVMTASQEDINGNCNNCTRCEVIKKVVELSKLVKDTLRTTHSSALDIEPNTDMTVSAYTNIPSSRVHSTCITRPDKSRTLKNEERQAFYMDLLPGSDKILEVSWCKTSNRKDSLMSARLISKTNLTNSGDVRLANNETLWDKLLQLYKEKSHGKKPTSKQIHMEKQTNVEKPSIKQTNLEKQTNKQTDMEKETSKLTNVEKQKSKQTNVEKQTNEQINTEKQISRQTNVEKQTSKQPNVNLEKRISKQPNINLEKETSKQPNINLEKQTNEQPVVNLEKQTSKQPNINSEKRTSKQPNINSEKQTSKRPNINLEKQTSKQPIVNLEKQTSKQPNINLEKQTNEQPVVNLEKQTSKQPNINSEKRTSKQPNINLEKETSKQPIVNLEKQTSKQPNINLEKQTNEKPVVNLEKQTSKPPNINSEKQTSKRPNINLEKQTSKQPIVNLEKQTSKQPNINLEKQTNEQPVVNLEKHTSKQPNINSEKRTSKQPNINLEKETSKQPIVNLEKQTSKQPNINSEKQTNEQPVVNLEKQTRKQPNINSEKRTSKQPNMNLEKQTSKQQNINLKKQTSKQPNVLKKSDNEASLVKITERNNKIKPAIATKTINTSNKRSYPNDNATSDNKKKKIENNFPRGLDRAKLVDAPVFYPTEAEFTDPISYFKKIMPIASQFGISKVIPPDDFTPACTLSATSGFTINLTNQYIPRLYTRWGPAFREMCAIRSYLASQEVHFTRAPLVGGLEVNLPKMYHTVQRLGGLKNVLDKQRWNQVAEEMHFYQLMNPSKKLEQIYVKYLLPYDTLTNRERQMKISEVEQMWQKKNKKMLARAINPLHHQKRLLGDSNSDSDSDMDQDAGLDLDEEVGTSGHVNDPLAEAEKCIVPGRTMNLHKFEKVAQNAFKMYIPPNEEPNTQTIENLYWKLVLFGADHVCVNSASVDTGEEGYGFTKNKSNPYGEHPWNLKVISQNNGNLLRPLGPVLGLTVPTLHLGMIFSTSCWHRDPHGLPWIEYMHQGPEKIWYGIPDAQSQNFRKAVEILCPTVCQNKGIWLSSDITMIPPNMLLEHEVSLSRVTQKPNEFVIVFPKAYSSSICTGYTISESVYFATQSWLGTMATVFQELRESCEPTMFALEQLLIAVARDARSSLCVLQQVRATLSTVITEELAGRAALKHHGLQVTLNKGRRGKQRLIRHQDECEICRTTLYLSKVKGVFGKQSALCVQHALRVLIENKNDTEDRKKKNENIELEIFFTKNEFEEIEQNLQNRLLSINSVDK